MPKSPRGAKVRASLKKHFIPHEGNNYHPHILHGKRTVFYGVFLTLIKVFVITYAVVIPFEAYTAPDVLAAQAGRILALTNDLRETKGLPALAHVAVLDRSSEARASDMAAKGYFSHVSPDGRTLSSFLAGAGYKYSSAGENLAMGFSEAIDVIDAWIKSPTHYANLVDREFKEFGIGMSEGTYDGAPTVFVAEHFGLPLGGSPEVQGSRSPGVQQEATTTPGSNVTPSPSSAPSDGASGGARPRDLAPSSSTIALHPSTPASEKPPVAISPSRPLQPKPETPPAKPTSVPPAETPSHITTPSPSFAPSDGASDGARPLALTPSRPDALTPPTSTLLAFTAPTYDRARSVIHWSDTDDGRTRIDVEAALGGDVASASALVQGYPVDLIPDVNGSGRYVGSAYVGEPSSQVFRTAVASTITVYGKDGTILRDAIAFAERKAAPRQTALQKYASAKYWFMPVLSVFSVSYWVYFAFLVFFAAALLLSIVIEFKKQHPHVVYRTIGFLVFIFLMWRF